VRTLSTVSKVFMWMFMVVYFGFQSLAVLGIMSSNASAGEGGKTFSPVPLIVATLLMLAAVILFTVLPKRKWIGVIISVVAAGVMLMVALELGRMFPPSVSTTGTVGLTTWKLIWRHIGISMVAVFMIVACLADRQLEKEYYASRQKSGYNLSGDPLFKGLDDPEEMPVKMKRSIKDRIRKQKELQ